MGYATERFSKRLKELREIAGLTQEQLAKELNVSRGAISYYEKCERTPDIEFLESTSMFFDVPLDYLMGNTENINEDHMNMYEFYGLTDEACDELDDTFGSLGHIISHIITNKSFFGIQHLIDTAIENYKIFHKLEVDYLIFVLTKHLSILILEAIESELNTQYTTEDIKELNNDISALLKRYDDYKTKCEKEEIAFKKELEERSAKNLKEIHFSTSYKARTAVHEKLHLATNYLGNE